MAGASFELNPGRTLAVVGESGCGKSTLARLVTMIERPTAGHLEIDGTDIATASAATLRTLRPRVQMVFQDPYGSLNPRKQVGQVLEEPLEINTSLDAKARGDAARQMLSHVGLRPEHYSRYPHMFSGGQRQRIAIARALMLRPKIVVADEPVSALDVSIRAQVLNLLMDLQQELNLAYMFISHDLSVVRHIADDVMVMYLGRPVEQGTRGAGLRRSPPSLYPGSAGGDPFGRSQGPVPTPHRQGRTPVADRPAFGLRLPPALPLRHRALRPGTPGIARGRGAVDRPVTLLSQWDWPIRQVLDPIRSF